MQKRAMAEKAKIYWDGVEVDGLSRVQEVTLEKSTIEIPEFKRKRLIQSGVTTIPAIELDYIIKRNNNALAFFNSFYDNDEIKDAILVRTDASGAEFERILWQSCECIKKVKPAYEAGNPQAAKITITIIPWDIITLS